MHIFWKSLYFNYIQFITLAQILLCGLENLVGFICSNIFSALTALYPRSGRIAPFDIWSAIRHILLKHTGEVFSEYCLNVGPICFCKSNPQQLNPNMLNLTWMYLSESALLLDVLTSKNCEHLRSKGSGSRLTL